MIAPQATGYPLRMTTDKFRPTHYLTDVHAPEHVRPIRVIRKIGHSVTWIDKNRIEGHTPAKDIRKLDLAAYPKEKTVGETAALLFRAFPHDFTVTSMPEPREFGNGFVLVEWTGGPDAAKVRDALRQEFHALEFQVHRVQAEAQP